MTRKSNPRRRPAVHITLGRAARLHRLVTMLGLGPSPREALLTGLGVGLRTFYRELELLRKCSVKIRLDKRNYRLTCTPAEAEGRLPFPDPQLSFAEMAELSQGQGEAAKRLATLLASVTSQSSTPAKAAAKRRKPKAEK